MTDQTVSASTATVVVFTPPPVDAGDAPMNIRMMLISLLDCRMDARSTELKPAVRIVVDCMRAFTSLFPAPEMPPSVAGLCHSVRQKNVIPIKSSTPVMPSTNRLWSDNSRHWNR